MVFFASRVDAQSPASVSGTVRDETGGVLPGVIVEARSAADRPIVTTSDARGVYRLEAVPQGRYQLTFSLVNFATARLPLVVDSGAARADAVLHLALNADVLVVGKRTFANLADLDRPAENLVGVAQSASQGAITARQLETRPVMRAGEVLETVPGIVTSQHSGEGKANQYYLRGFNLDHGTDFATTVAGMPVNMPTHGHGHGYSDLNFLIPELVAGVQYSKGPYFAEQGDFATAGAANINYVNTLAQPLVRIAGGDQGFARALAAGAIRRGAGQILAGVEVGRNDGPWDMPDDYRKVNGIVRYTRGDAANGFSLTGMGYRAQWNSTDQVPARAIQSGLVGRFGALDATDGGDTHRYSGSVEWQKSRGNGSTRLTAYGIGYDMNLFSNFTFFLDDPVDGDQFHQGDRRFISGAKMSHKRIGRLAGRETQNAIGVHLRNDHIASVRLDHTAKRVLLETVRKDAVLQTSVGTCAQNETVWSPWLRSLAGLRVDGYRFKVDAGDPANGGVVRAAIASPKGGVVLGPWKGTELYASAGFGFHSNDARGATMTRDPRTGEAVDPVTPLVRAKGTELGVRSVALPHLQTTVAVWTLSLDSELLFVGDAGTTESGRPSHRFGVEWTNYFTPRPWLILEGDISWSDSHFTDDDPAGDHIPGAVQTVVSAGLTIDRVRNIFGSVRLRYFGARPLIEDATVRSKATGLVNLEVGYTLGRNIRVAVDVFNVLNARDSDIDYYYTSRLPGEPGEGIDDIHLHPVLPRTVRVNLILGF